MRISIIILSLFSIWSCSADQQQQLPLASGSDYAKYLSGYESAVRQAIEKYDQEIAFWESKVRAQPDGYTYLQKLASLLAKRFELTGEIENIMASDSLFLRANERVAGKQKIGNYYALSSNAITQHQFKKAEYYSAMAYEASDEKWGPMLMIFDACMELGKYEKAGGFLQTVADPDSFDYLVRLSKYQDHTGYLDSAIVTMEYAFQLAKESNTQSMIAWAGANLGDMYGHAGRIEDSYRAFLQVLENDPTYSHALKGIAWIAYAHDKNPVEAKKILQTIASVHALPDVHFLLAEMAAYEQNFEEEKRQLAIFFEQASQQKYQGMYSKYLIEIENSLHKNYDRAIALAQHEIEKRPTPASYDLLAWSYYHQGDYTKALDIAQTYIEGKTCEPEIAYHLASIYLANGNTSKAKVYFQLAKESAYELGPVTVQEMQNNMES